MLVLISSHRVETVNKELNRKAGMKENVSLITDGCDNMLSKVGDDHSDDDQ